VGIAADTYDEVASVLLVAWPATPAVGLTERPDDPRQHQSLQSQRQSERQEQGC
jgi:hypothetical protein